MKGSKSFLLGFVLGAIIFCLTALFMGTAKAVALPGGAVSAGLLVGFQRRQIFFSVLGALAGHILCSLIV